MLMYAALSVAVFVAQTPPEAQRAAQAVRDRLATQRTHLGFGVLPSFLRKSVLLYQTSVQKELQITDDQKKRLAAVEGKLARKYEQVNSAAKKKLDEYRRARQNEGVPYDPEELKALSEEANAARTAFVEQSESAKLEILDRDQRARLGEIQMQAEGLMAFQRDDVQRRLNLGPEQVAEIAAIMAESRQRMVDVSALPPHFARAAGPEDREREAAVKKSREAALNVRGTSIQATLKLLTRKQREVYTRMLGKPFDLGSLNSDSRTAGPR
ncbi:MAG: hypothetical protein U0835_18400 [Isosphaeraceae bacterium]